MSARLEVDDLNLEGLLSPHLAELAQLSEAERADWYQGLPQDTREALPYLWEFWARPNQLWRPGPEKITLVQAGRGFGKTRYGAQAVRWVAENPELCGFGRGQLDESAPIIALIGRTAQDCISTMIKGTAGILACSPPWFRPVFKSSEKLLTWPNGMRAHYFTAEIPETLRGSNIGFAWADEVAFFKPLRGEQVGVIENIEQALRHACEKAVFTTTPLPTAEMIRLHERSKPRPRVVIDLGRHPRRPPESDETLEPDQVEDDLGCDPRPPEVRIVRGSSLDNAANQGQDWVASQRAKAHTRIGRQEVGGELLEGNPRSLFKLELLNDRRITLTDLEALVGEREAGESYVDYVKRALQLERICVACDPNGTDATDPNTGADAAEFGIQVVGLGVNGREYSLQDLSGHHGSLDWPEIVYDAALVWGADAIVAETNYGGSMVRAAMETYVRSLRDKREAYIPIQFVEVRTGKAGKASRLKVFAQAVEARLVWSVGDPSIWAPLEAQLHAFDPSKDPDKQVARIEIRLADGSIRTESLRLDRMDARVWAHLYLSGHEIARHQSVFFLGENGAERAIGMLESLE